MNNTKDYESKHDNMDICTGTCIKNKAIKKLHFTFVELCSEAGKGTD